MRRIIASSLGLSLQFYFITSTVMNSELLFKTEDLILRVAEKQFGRFDCVFLNLNPELSFSEDWINGIILSPRLALLSRFILDPMYSGTFTNIPYKPALLVVRTAGRVLQREMNEGIERIFSMFDCNTRALVLVDSSTDRSLLNVQNLLTKLQYDKVIYLTSKERLAMRYNIFGKNYFTSNIDLETSQHFNSILRNSSGRPIKLAIVSYWHLTAIWVMETSKFLQTQFHFYQNCNVTTTVMGCIQQIQKVQNIDMSLDKFRLPNLPVRHHYISNVLPNSQVVLVPKSRQYTDVEMFIKPFTLQVWIVLIIALSTIEAINAMFPNLFKNDPVLISIFRLERFTLHRISAGEKLSMLSLIIFFFVVFNAYETMFISFMLNKPSPKSISTLQELMESGLRIKCDRRGDSSMLTNPIVKALMIQDDRTDSSVSLNGKNAYLMNSERASLVTSLWINYDFKF